MRTPVPPPWSLSGPGSLRRGALLLGLTLLGALGNSCPVSLVFGLDLVFGQIAILVAAAFVGTRTGTLMALLASLPTWLLWGHPGGPLVLTLEVTVIALLRRHRQVPVVLADLAYWTVVGIPLTLLVTTVLPAAESPDFSLFALKCLANGLLNAATASLLVVFLPWERWCGPPARSPHIGLPVIMLNLVVVAVLLPTTVLLVNTGRRAWAEAEDDALRSQDRDIRRLVEVLQTWSRTQRRAVALLAAEVSLARDAATLQTVTRALQRTFPALYGLGVSDPQGRFLSLQRQDDGPGYSGTDHGLPGIPARDDPAPTRLLWNTEGLGADLEPLLILSQPARAQGRPVETAVAAVRLSDLNRILSRHVPGPFERATLVDARSRVVASTDPGLLPCSTYEWHREPGAGRRRPGPLWRQPSGSPSDQRFWGQSSLTQVRNLEPALPVTLILETSLVPIQHRLNRDYTQSLATALALSLVAVAAVWLVAAWSLRPVPSMAAASLQLARRLEEAELPSVPTSPIVELEILSRTFTQMARELRERFGELTRKNLELERVNRALTEETHQRLEMEQRMRQAQRLEALGLFAGGVAHDFNNLLAAILGYADLAAGALPPEHPAREGLQMVRESSLRARTLIHQILSFGKPSRRSGQALRLQEALSESLILLKSALPRTIRLQVDLAEDVGPVEFDRDDLGRILVNLASNAENAMRDRAEGTLTLGLRRITLDPQRAESLELEPSGSYALLEVADTGCGIPEQDLPHLFEPFFTTRAQGTGLGLPLVRDIVRGHRGGLEVQSAPGQGTRMLLYLPLAQASSGPRPAPVPPLPETPADELPRGCERVLFVDDEVPLARLGRLALGQLGYRVESFTHPERALERFREDPTAWDLLVTDQAMPGMSGTRLLAQMRQLLPGLPAVLCTGFGREDYQEQAEALGLSEVLSKPLTLPELAAAVRRALDGRKGRGLDNRQR